MRHLAQWRNADGTVLALRRMRASDAPRVKEALGTLSAEARRNRFFSTVADFSDDLVRRLTVVDPRQEWALVIVRIDDAGEHPIAGGRFVLRPEPGCCEFSLLVGDAWQGQGLGRRLLKALMGEARRRRLRWMIGHVLADNRPMLMLARSLRFEIEDNTEDPAVKRVVRELPLRRVHRLAGWLQRLRRRFV